MTKRGGGGRGRGGRGGRGRGAHAGPREPPAPPVVRSILAQRAAAPPDSKPTAAPAPVPEPAEDAPLPDSLVLLDHSGAWCGDTPVARRMLSAERSEGAVLGVLGRRGVGKSHVLNTLAGRRVFPEQSSEAFASASAQTTAVAVHAASRGALLLDTPPLLEVSQAQSKVACLDVSAQVRSVRVAAFTLTVCDTVLVTSDWLADTAVWHTLLLAEQVVTTLPLARDDAGTPVCARMLLVGSRVPKQDRTPRLLQRAQACANAFFARSGLLSDAAPQLDGTVAEKRAVAAVASVKAPALHHAVDAPRRRASARGSSQQEWLRFAERVWSAVEASPAMHEYARTLEHVARQTA